MLWMCLAGYANTTTCTITKLEKVPCLILDACIIQEQDYATDRINGQTASILYVRSRLTWSGDPQLEWKLCAQLDKTVTFRKIVAADVDSIVLTLQINCRLAYK